MAQPKPKAVLIAELGASRADHPVTLLLSHPKMELRQMLYQTSKLHPRTQSYSPSCTGFLLYGKVCSLDITLSCSEEFVNCRQITEAAESGEGKAEPLNKVLNAARYIVSCV